MFSHNIYFMVLHHHLVYWAISTRWSLLPGSLRTEERPSKICIYQMTVRMISAIHQATAIIKSIKPTKSSKEQSAGMIISKACQTQGCFITTGVNFIFLLWGDFFCVLMISWVPVYKFIRCDKPWTWRELTS